MDGFVVVHRVTIHENKIDEFESKFKNFINTVNFKKWGVKLSLFVKESQRANVYQIITVWVNEESYNFYINSEESKRFIDFTESEISSKRYKGNLLGFANKIGLFEDQ